MADGAKKAGLRRARHRTIALVSLALLLVAILALAAERRRHAHRQADLGERLLQGGSAGGADRVVADGGATVLRGRLAGHPGDLPPEATRCLNCHASGIAKGQPSTAAFGPSLDSDSLARAVSRRGGPPSRYDVDSLCRLLRDGIDPAWVMIDASMPRYDVSDAQCRALWTRLARPPIS